MTAAVTTAGLADRRVWVMAKGYAPDEGGMQTYARAVAASYARAGADVTVFTRTSAGPRDLQLGAVRVIDVGPGKGLLAYFRLARQLLSERRASGAPLLLHATTWRTSVVPMLLGLRYITTFHGRELMYPRGWKGALMRRVARNAIRLIAVSRYTAQALQQRVSGLARAPVVAWNGVTPDLWRREQPPADAAVPLILALCRHEPRKNLRAAVEAAAVCRNEGLAFRFVLAGRGEEHDALRDAIARHRLEHVVDLAGFVDQQRAQQLYRDADIFIHPHVTRDGGRDFEGFGIAIADAMFTRTAVIGGEAGGGRELIEDQVSGLLVDGTRQQDVTAALRRLLSDAPFRRALSAAAGVRAEREFSWDRHVAIVIDGLV